MDKVVQMLKWAGENWIAVVVMAAAGPMIWAGAKKVVNDGPRWALTWAREKWKERLAKGDIDADAQELVRTIFKALAHYAEKKIPDDGMGPARMKLILDTLGKIPVVGWLVKKYEKETRELIEDGVKAMDRELKDA